MIVSVRSLAEVSGHLIVWA
uniref:Uncharacterized protein n=1 Tax=Arundo donax TaxID=35708 RepID=A0A0A9ASN9_ARUDO